MVPPRKKPSAIQPTIHQFFAPKLHTESSTSSEDSFAVGNENASPLAPALPENVHSSLLQVGMRVRKSIRDGYKTTPAPLAPANQSVYTFFQQSKNKRNIADLKSVDGQEKGGMDTEMLEAHTSTARQYAIPKSRKRAGFWNAVPRKESSSLSTNSEDPEDFEEAEFLKPMEELI
ncbi:hypothetical protein BJ508DRAFT_303031 [Ascobolus immersus RN42]|uniref:Uncharacterized protein n=1 Tax=Ascobolus immersus RN42 TaxID=1160509 RepID=A0A3N4IKZ3_ASCIM|nr:hypothetical protein BJ508DRAFT_303031 [Ascobolus immersus RN42]